MKVMSIHAHADDFGRFIAVQPGERFVCADQAPRMADGKALSQRIGLKGIGFHP